MVGEDVTEELHLRYSLKEGGGSPPGGEGVGGGHHGKRKYCMNRGMKSQIFVPYVVM